MRIRSIPVLFLQAPQLRRRAVPVTSQRLIFAAFPEARSRLVGGLSVGAGISAAGLIFHLVTGRGSPQAKDAHPRETGGEETLPPADAGRWRSDRELPGRSRPHSAAAIPEAVP